MNEKAKKLLNKVFSKEELLEIMVEVLKEDRKIYSNSKRLHDLLALSIQKKQEEVFAKQERLLREESIDFFKRMEQYEKLDKKLKLLEECMSVLYERSDE